MPRVTICGGGNLGHALAGWLASQKGASVRVLVSSQQRASSWETGIAAQGGIAVITPIETRHGRPELVTADPAEAVKGAGVVLIAQPALLHHATLARIAPFIESHALVGAIPAHGGFQWIAEEAFRSIAAKPVIFGFRKSPWTCRVATYGQSVRITGIRTAIEIAAEPAAAVDRVAKELALLFGIEIVPLPHFLHVTLSIGNQILHPGILYGLLRHWNGIPYAEAPLAYQGLNTAAADILRHLSDESQAVGYAVDSALPCLQLRSVRSLADEMRASAQGQIEDISTLQTTIATNRALFGLRIPCKQIRGGWIPDVTSRYFAEDIPFGLCVLRGIAEISEIATPMMDEVINWAQAQLTACYLCDGSISGTDVARCGAPQAFGLRTVSQLM